MQRWDDLTPEEQQRYTDAEQLRAQLAAATQRAETAETESIKLHGQVKFEHAKRNVAEYHNGQVLYLLCNYGHYTATAHRTWLLDQIARELLGSGYDSWMECLKADGLSWGTGERPK